MNEEFLHIPSPSLISMKQGTTAQSELQVIHMKRTTKKLLLRAGTMTAALGITLGAAVYGAHKLPPTVPASISGDGEPQVIILDAGHGECSKTESDKTPCRVGFLQGVVHFFTFGIYDHFFTAVSFRAITAVMTPFSNRIVNEPSYFFAMFSIIFVP